jgi:hypothetical protein
MRNDNFTDSNYIKMAVGQLALFFVVIFPCVNLIVVRLSLKLLEMFHLSFFFGSPVPFKTQYSSNLFISWVFCVILPLNLNKIVSEIVITVPYQ